MGDAPRLIRGEDGWEVASVRCSLVSDSVGRVWSAQLEVRPVHLLPQQGGGVPVDR